MLRPIGGHAAATVGGEAPRCGAARLASIAARHSADVSLSDGPRRLSLRASGFRRRGFQSSDSLHAGVRNRPKSDSGEGSPQLMAHACKSCRPAEQLRPTRRRVLENLTDAERLRRTRQWLWRNTDGRSNRVNRPGPFRDAVSNSRRLGSPVEGRTGAPRVLQESSAPPRSGGVFNNRALRPRTAAAHRLRLQVIIDIDVRTQVRSLRSAAGAVRLVAVAPGDTSPQYAVHDSRHSVSCSVSIALRLALAYADV